MKQRDASALTLLQTVGGLCGGIVFQSRVKPRESGLGQPLGSVEVLIDSVIGHDTKLFLVAQNAPAELSRVEHFVLADSEKAYLGIIRLVAVLGDMLAPHKALRTVLPYPHNVQSFRAEAGLSPRVQFHYPVGLKPIDKLFVIHSTHPQREL